jgi:hypothetical protein
MGEYVAKFWRWGRLVAVAALVDRDFAGDLGTDGV